MGLDVYLYHYADFALAQRAEAAHEAETSALWDQFGERDVETYRAKVAEAELRNGMKDYHHESVTAIENDSAAHPNHMFKVGYFRSSYNEAGTDRILRTHADTDLAGIFGVGCGDHYHVRPDWGASKARTEAAIAALRTVRADPLGRLRAEFVRATPLRSDSVARSEEAALAVARKAMAEASARPEGWRSYGSAAGEFSLDGMDVVALLVGTRHDFDGPGLWVVRRDAETWLDWYIQALEIVVETIDYVTAHSGQGGEFVLHWSA